MVIYSICNIGLKRPGDFISKSAFTSLVFQEKPLSVQIILENTWFAGNNKAI
jgi:hypothetical protein